MDRSARLRPGSMYKPGANVLYPTYTGCSSRCRIVGHGPVHRLPACSSWSCAIRALTRSHTYLDYSPVDTRSSHSRHAMHGTWRWAECDCHSVVTCRETNPTMCRPTPERHA